MIYSSPLRLPFGIQMRQARPEQYPEKDRLLTYLREVRQLTRARLEEVAPDDLSRSVIDKDFGVCTVRDIWAGIVTSFAWHAGQIAMTAKMLPDSPIETMEFEYWKQA